MALKPRCYKFHLPNKKVVDVLDDVIIELNRWLQNDGISPESGGYILGYEHKQSQNATLESLTPPQPDDLKSRYGFHIRDSQHSLIIRNHAKLKSYYMGLWHTHPQNDPVPSTTDWRDWNATLVADVPASHYIFFLIAGIDRFRIWVGDKQRNSIFEAHECKLSNGLYHSINRLDRKI